MSLMKFPIKQIANQKGGTLIDMVMAMLISGVVIALSMGLFQKSGDARKDSSHFEDINIQLLVQVLLLMVIYLPELEKLKSRLMV